MKHPSGQPNVHTELELSRRPDLWAAGNGGPSSRLGYALDQGMGNEVELRWRQGLHPVYAVSVATFVAVLLTIAFRKGQFQPVHRGTMFAAGLGLAYSLLVQLVNATRLVREGAVLRVTHGPLPWRGATRVPVDQIRTLRCDPSSRRLLLRTTLGEELVLGENLAPDTLGPLDLRLADLVRTARP